MNQRWLNKGGGWGSLSQCLPHPQEINTANAAIWSAVGLDIVARGPAIFLRIALPASGPHGYPHLLPQVAASATAGLPGAVTLEGEREEGGLGGRQPSAS